MKQICYKYQGTGNDFILIDNRLQTFPKNDNELIARLCERRFGIGADGFILLENDKSTDFKMVYYNADGSESTMCGNGGRCMVAFAKKLNIIQNNTVFHAIDGLHYAMIDSENDVTLQMKDVDQVQIAEGYVFLNTGSPHHVQMVDDLKNYAVKQEGARIRYSDLYGKAGSNINFVSGVNASTFAVRTYERGVEDETLSCGTGVTAVAIAMHYLGKTKDEKIKLQVEGGDLEVSFEAQNGKYTQVFLKGPATFVFEAVIDI